jgi:Ca2+-transporting ATPase
MEKAEPNIMRRKPRSAKSGIFADGMGFDIGYQGALVTVLVLISYFIGDSMGGGAHGTTMAFLTMSLAEIFHSFNMRSQRQSIFKLGSVNKFLLLAGIGSFIATVVVCEVEFLAQAFGFVPVGLEEFLIAIALGICVIPVVEIVKLIQRKITK